MIEDINMCQMHECGECHLNEGQPSYVNQVLPQEKTLAEEKMSQIETSKELVDDDALMEDALMAEGEAKEEE